MSDRHTVRWVHAPGHVNGMTRPVIERAELSHALVIDWSEMYHNIDDLKAYARNYDHLVGHPGRIDRRKRPVNHDVVISTRKDAEILHDESFFVDHEIPQILKYLPERHGKARVIKFHGITILIIAWHPQPGGLRWTELVLPHYRHSVMRVETVQRRLENKFKPDLVLNGGDLQMRPGKNPYRPNHLAKRLGMKWDNHKIDWQMWSSNWEAIEDHLIDPSRLNKKMDHMWMERKLVQVR